MNHRLLSLSLVSVAAWAWPVQAQTNITSPAAPNATRSGSDANEAVTTNSRNEPEPSSGENSFTQGQAEARLEKNGFSQVSGLKMGLDGVWRGSAIKDGKPVVVWVDFKGNVGKH